MSWKQPLPTELEEIFGEDYQCNLLYRELVYRCANSDKTFKLGKKYVTINRGQSFFGRNKYALYLDWSPSKVERVFQRLCKKPDIFSDINRSRSFTIVTMKDYDTVIGMDKYSDKKRTSGGQESDTSKSVKSVKKIIKRKNIKKKKLEKQKEEELQMVMQEILDSYNKQVDGVYHLTDGIKTMIRYWLTQYSKEDFLKAISKIKQHDFWGKPNNQHLPFVLRTKNKAGPQDAIGDLLNFRPPKKKDDLDLGWNPYKIVSR